MSWELSLCGNYYSEIDVDQWSSNDLIGYPTELFTSSGPKDRDEELLKEFEKMLNEGGNTPPKFDPWFDPWFDPKKDKKTPPPPKKPTCECGAGHTKFPNHHADYCPLDKKKK